MNDPMRELNRREVLSGGLVLGAGLLLVGCQKKTTVFKPLTPEELEGPPHVQPPEHRIASGPTAGPVSGVIARREWTSTGPIMSLINPMNGVDRITIHHSAVISAGVRGKTDAARMLTSIRSSHVTNGWADIGYHYIIDPQGNIWEGRPVKYQGAHVKENNEHNLGIMCMGNFDEERPTPAMLATLDGFVADRMRALRVPIHRVYTHQELRRTECPGRNLQGYMVATRSGSGRMARA
jgi:hypothetical protein